MGEFTYTRIRAEWAEALEQIEHTSFPTADRADLYDATLTMQIANGFEAPGVIADYITDPAVDSWASLIVWENADYNADA